MHANVWSLHHSTHSFRQGLRTYPDFLTRHQRLVSTLMRQGFKYDLLCRKFKQFYRSHFDLISRYSKSVTQHLREVSIVRFSEPVVIVAAHAPSSWSGGCLHWPWLSASLVPLSLFLGRSLFYIEFFSTVVHELDFLFCFSFQDVWEEWRYACVLTVMWVKVRMCRNACEWACGCHCDFKLAVMRKSRPCRSTLRVLIKQIAAKLCCIARRDRRLDC